MGFQQYLDTSSVALDVILELGVRNAMTLHKGADELGPGFKFYFHHEGLSPQARYFLGLLSNQSQSACAEVFCLSRMFAEGIKLFQPGRLLLDSFAHYDLNLAAGDYHQPFPTFCVDFPDDYAQEHSCLSTGGERQTPWGAVLHHDVANDSLHCIIPLSSRTCLTYHMDLGAGGTVEECVEDNRGRCLSGMTQSDGEWAMMEAAFRACVNLALMATSYGLRELGPANPAHHRRASERLQKAKKKGRADLAEVNRRDLVKIPFCYGFDQSCPLLTALAGGGPGTVRQMSEGEHVTPHWRRGHWRTQRFGPGLSQSKVIAIPAVMVNADLVLGGAAATRVRFD